MSVITKLESDVKGVFAKVDGDVVKAAAYIVTSALPELEKVEADAPTIEGIAGLAGPQAQKVAVVLVTLGAKVVSTIKAGEAAVAGGGVNVTLDGDLLADLKAVFGL